MKQWEGKRCKDSYDDVNVVAVASSHFWINFFNVSEAPSWPA